MDSVDCGLDKDPLFVPIEITTFRSMTICTPYVNEDIGLWKVKCGGGVVL